MKAGSRTDPVKARTRQLHATLKRRAGGAEVMSLAEFRALYGERVNGYTRCPYCFVFLTAANISLDHRTPVARGGGHDGANLQFICRGCNTAKADRTAEEFADLMRMLDEWQIRHRNLHLRDGVLTALRVASSFRLGANRRAKR